MSKRTLCFNWSSLAGARKKKRKLYFEEDENHMFVCPVTSCLHEAYKSKRGLRKHVNNHHEWYLYFDAQPEVKREDAEPRIPAKRKASTHRQAGFSVENGCGAHFVEWLLTPCGGGKNSKDAIQVAKRAMKYLMYCIGDCDDGVVAPEPYIDCCLGSPTMLMKFLNVIVEQWGLKAAGAISYLHAISDLLDYRKCHGVSDSTLRLFTVTEVYLRRSKSTLYKKRNLEYSRDLSLESLIAQQSWATLEEMDKVIPYHTSTYQQIYESAGRDSGKVITISELAFATRFIITFLLLRVKCTRPMSLQYLTMEMLDAAVDNDGFVDQTKFKTKDQFVFDTLKFSKEALEVVESYRKRIRPLCKPKCEFVIVTTNGTQYTAFCNALSVLTFQAINKHITPTRYRAIVETESLERLTKEQQAIITKDQRHSSFVARRCYQKKLSRDVATDGAEAMKKLVGEGREKHTSALADSLRGCEKGVADTEDTPTSSSKPNSTPASKKKTVPDSRAIASSSKTARNTPGTPIVLVESITIPDSDSPPSKDPSTDVEANLRTISDLDVKKEEMSSGKKFLTFTTEEDDFLKAGLQKHAKSNKIWSDILHDAAYHFQEGRTRDSLRVRATSLGVQRKKKSMKDHGKSSI